MAYFIPLLLYLGLGGGLLLLGIGSVPSFRFLRKPLSAALVTALSLVWLLVPQTGRWVLSVWAPSSVTGGWMLLDVQPSLWWCILVTGLALSGVLWTSVSERTPEAPLTGALLIILLVVIWSALTAGSLLMTLAMWAVFDVIWFVVRLMVRADGERVVWASAVNGVATLLLWSISLFLLRDGVSGLWWLMRPSSSALTLLMVAAFVRIGFYPFQILYIESPSRSRPLSVIGMLSPIMGVALLYRLMSLSPVEGLPAWGMAWASISVLWMGIKAMVLSGKRAPVAAGYAVFLAVVAGAVVQHNPVLLMDGVATWAACMALLFTARRHSSVRPFWSAPTAVALAFLLGAPPSPLGRVYRDLFTTVPWVWRVMLLFGLVGTFTALLQKAVRTAVGRVVPPEAWRRIALISGWVLLGWGLVVLVRRSGFGTVSLLSVSLWGLALVAAVAVAHWGSVVRGVLVEAQPVVELLDMQWFYRTVWQGAEHLLGVLRVGAEVVEGSGSVLWSVLVLLLVLVVLGSV